MRYVQCQYHYIHLTWAVSTYADDAVRTDELHKVVGNRALGVALGVGLDVAEVTDVAVLILGSAVGLAMGVNWR